MTDITTDTPATSAETTTWSGEPGWPRPRSVPMHDWGRSGPAAACFVQDRADDPLSASSDRTRQCFEQYACQVCGDTVGTVDSVGWVLRPAANMGGACCTRCMYLAVRTCPHLSGAPDGDWEFWAVTSPHDYRWHVKDDVTTGHILPVEARAVQCAWGEFLAHYKWWKSVTR